MNLFTAISEWKAARHQKWLVEMESQGKCPDCVGRGVNMTTLYQLYQGAPLDCPGCNGSGLFSDWSETNPQDS